MSLSRTLANLSKVITQGNFFMITTHILPDGDGIGSLLGMSFLLKKLKKKVFLGWAEEVPSQYAFLPGATSLKTTKILPQKQGILVTVDCPSLKRLGRLENLTKRAKIIVNIDHHPQNENFGKINLVDEEAPASAELILKLSKTLKVKLDENIATCLYVGLVTDTGRFQYANTNTRAFEAAKELLKFKLSPPKLYQKIYENISFGNLKLLSKTLNWAHFEKELKLVYSRVTQKDLLSTGVKMGETENYIDYLRAVKQAQIVAIFKETPEGFFKISLRSKDEIDVGKVARRFGGGGHRNAAAYLSSKPFNKALKDLCQTLNRFGSGQALPETKKI